MTKSVPIAGAWLMLGGLALAADAAFTVPPSAATDGAGARITFTVAAPTDVEVAVLGADGSVVNHLAAGVLGTNPPSPLRPGLAQELAWNGHDDQDKPAAGGPFQVRVRLGMRPQLDGFLLENPAATGPARALAVGPRGALYVFHPDASTGAGHYGSPKIKVLTREGKYDHTVMPFASTLSPERLKALNVMQSEGGELVPRIYHYLRFSFYPDPSWRSPAQCPVVDSRGRVHWLVLGPALASLDADGGVPYDTLIGPNLLPGRKDLNMANMWFYGQSRPGLALSSDEKFLYFAGLTTGDPKKKEPIKGVPCVYRVDLATRGPAEPFLGKPESPGAEGDLLVAPRGLAVAQGLIYVADHDADRIAVFHEKDRSLAGEIKVKRPDSLGVDPESGAVYVCSAANVKVPDLVKFENYRTGKELLRQALPPYKYADQNGVAHRIAVDASAKPVRIWLPAIPYSQYELLCYEDAGDRFNLLGDPRGKEPSAEGPRDLTYDRVRGELYVKVNHQRWYRIDEKTGQVTFQFRIPDLSLRPEFGTQLVPGPDGNLYTYSWSGDEAGLRLYTREGKPLAWPGMSKNHIPLPGVMNYMQRSLTLRGDELYLVPPGNWRTESGGGGVPDGTTSLNVYGLDGKVRRTLVWQCMKGAILRLDRQGNIYLADTVKPPDRSFPAFFDGKVKLAPTPTSDQTDSFYYSYMYGSIIKFPPAGGAIWFTTNVGPYAEGKVPADLLAKPKTKVRVHVGYQTRGEAELQGALWYRFGFAPYTAENNSCMLTCMCEGGGFDVDPYGRVFFPNLGQFRVEVLDTNGNALTQFGRYGNQDDGVKPASGAVPLAWPLTVVTSETHAYVADTLSRRVAKVRLGWGAEARCAIR
jgi:hypothetical protein